MHTPVQSKSEKTESKQAAKVKRRSTDGPKNEKTAATSKTIYTEGNINTFLIEQSEKKDKVKLVNLLIFLFKTYGKDPAELLAKIKVLNMSSKKKIEGENIHKMIMEHLFNLTLSSDEGFYENLSEFLRGKGILIKVAYEWFFSNQLSTDDYNEAFTALCNLLESALKSSAEASMHDYLEDYGRLDSYEDLLDYEEVVVSEAKPKASISNDESTKESDCAHVEARNDVSTSNEEFSLVSLDDEDEMGRLDEHFGMLVAQSNKDVDLHYIERLFGCMELLVKHNYILRIEDLARLLYFCHFNASVSSRMKFILRGFMEKFQEKDKIIRIFQISCIILPSIYAYFSQVLAYCKDGVDLSKFFEILFKFEHEGFICNKREANVFYRYYKPEMGGRTDDFMLEVIRGDNEIDMLNELLQKEGLNDIIKAVVENRISRLHEGESKKAKRAERMPKADVSIKASSEEVSDIAIVSSEDSKSALTKSGKKVVGVLPKTPKSTKPSAGIDKKAKASLVVKKAVHGKAKSSVTDLRSTESNESVKEADSRKTGKDKKRFEKKDAGSKPEKSYARGSKKGPSREKQEVESSGFKGKRTPPTNAKPSKGDSRGKRMDRGTGIEKRKVETTNGKPKRFNANR